jgi:hypothetical protein
LCVAMSFAMPAVGENFNAWFSNWKVMWLFIKDLNVILLSVCFIK